MKLSRIARLPERLPSRGSAALDALGRTRLDWLEQNAEELLPNGGNVAQGEAGAAQVK
jgi:hypothetical protein